MACGQKYGCHHYERKVQFVTPCCDKIYTCRFCHDENEKHQINRKEVKEIVCMICETRQNVQEKCKRCQMRFADYTCLECRLFDDEDKKQYHCEGCGICRVGGRNNFFHCAKCNMCLPIRLFGNHACVENVSRSDCPVCMEDLHTSLIACYILICGHLIHGPCYSKMVEKGFKACPTCQTSIST